MKVTSDLNLTGANIRDTLDVGDNLHIVARVGAFSPDSTLFLLDPVATRFR